MRGRFRASKRWLFRGAVSWLRLLESVLPRSASLRVFAAIGSAVHLVDRPAVRRSLGHLEVAFGPQMSDERRREITHQMFRATARNLADFFRVVRRGPSEASALVRFEGLEHLEAARARGRGVIALSGHFGNWELLGAALVARGYSVSVLARVIFDRRADELLNSWRRRLGLRVYSRNGGLRPVLRLLREGGIVGALVDQDTDVPSAFVEFFGRPAKTPIVPFVVARRTGAALVPMFVSMDPETNVHRVRILPELAVSPEADPLQAVRDWHAALEEAIRGRPDQWVWHHRRWKTKPTRAAVVNLRSFYRKGSYLTRCQGSSETVIAR